MNASGPSGKKNLVAVKIEKESKKMHRKMI